MFLFIQSVFARIVLSSLLLLSFSRPALAQIIDLHSGRAIPVSELLGQLREAEMLLLGELHDNTHHHRERALLLKELARTEFTIVAEHLPAESKPVLTDPLLAALELAGFEKKAWGWPLHEPLFEQIRRSGYTLVGGNLQKGQSKALTRSGVESLPATMRDALERAKLDLRSSSALNEDLIDGHCGQLPAKYLASMQLIQRATDASFALRMLENKKAILVAGNGHVRKDYGVPQVIRSIAPNAKVISIGFHERQGDEKNLVRSLNGKYDFVWITEAVDRDDPCKDFKLK